MQLPGEPSNNMPQKLLLLDRDGTLILEPDNYQVDSPDKLDFYPGVFRWLGRIVRELDYKLVMITNQGRVRNG